jgi:hypothetical protein
LAGTFQLPLAGRKTVFTAAVAQSVACKEAMQVQIPSEL